MASLMVTALGGEQQPLGIQVVPDGVVARVMAAARRSAAAWRTGSSRHSGSASALNAAVEPETGRAHGTPSWKVLPQPPQATRGTSACTHKV